MFFFPPRNRFGVISAYLQLGTIPHPGWFHRQHLDEYSIFRFGNPELNLHLWRLHPEWGWGRPNLYPPGNDHISPSKSSWVPMILFSSSIGGIRDRALEGNVFLFFVPTSASCDLVSNITTSSRCPCCAGASAANGCCWWGGFFPTWQSDGGATKWAQKSPVISMESLWQLGHLIRDSISVG